MRPFSFAECDGVHPSVSLHGSSFPAQPAGALVYRASGHIPMPEGTRRRPF